VRIGLTEILKINYHCFEKLNTFKVIVPFWDGVIQKTSPKGPEPTAFLFGTRAEYVAFVATLNMRQET